jgi:phytoene/squalene synthetase
MNGGRIGGGYCLPNNDDAPLVQTTDQPANTAAGRCISSGAAYILISARTYDTNKYEAEKRDALERWASHVAVAVAQATGANVTTLKSRA